MELHEVFSVTKTKDDCLLIDMDYTGLEGRTRTLFAYRASDPYAPLAPVITKWLADNNPEILPYIPPEPEPEQPISIPAVTFWERTTEAEGTAIEAMLAQQPFRVRQIFMTAQSYRSDHELWPLLQSAAIGLFGVERAAELLAQP